MNRIFSLFAVFCMLISQSIFAVEHKVSHNMVLFGTEEIHASHLVYKVPHNYQVILSLSLSKAAKQEFLRTRETFPGDTFLLLLEPFDLRDIEKQERLRGKILRVDSGGKKVEIFPNVILEKADFKLIYFDEVPISLAETSYPH